MIEETVDINTADGRMETFLCYPERGGPYPPVFMDGQENAPLEEERLLDAGTTTMRLYGAFTLRRIWRKGDKSLARLG